MEQVARQSGIIPYQLEPDGLRVLLITSRETGRWVIPKGNIGKRHDARQAAKHEAYEEAGVSGAVEKIPLGFYTYQKILMDGTPRPTMVEVFAMQVRKKAKTWPEKAQRQWEWMAPEEAARRVQEPGLAVLLLRLAERHLDGEPAP
ncbi:NUDIX hydrolase [Acidocella sp.]|uniref:NUDIX hydrolase n=1 Tax=Acidocella sp. TaxID=50710 RepID=UPI003D0736CF